MLFDGMSSISHWYNSDCSNDLDPVEIQLVLKPIIFDHYIKSNGLETGMQYASINYQIQNKTNNRLARYPAREDGQEFCRLTK